MTKGLPSYWKGDLDHAESGEEGLSKATPSNAVADVEDKISQFDSVFRAPSHPRIDQRPTGFVYLTVSCIMG